MELTVEKKNFAKTLKNMDILGMNKIISSFVGHTEEYKELLSTAISSSTSSHKDNNVIVLSEDTSIADLVSHGVQISDMMKKLKSEIDIISQNLKQYGATKLQEWNKENNEDLASVRLSDGERTVLITVKNAYSIDDEKILSLKKELGSKFTDTFTVENSWTVKNDKIKDVISLLKNTLGKAGSAFIKEAFVEKNIVKVKSRKDLEKLLDSDISEEAKTIIKSAIKPQEPSITYPK